MTHSPSNITSESQLSQQQTDSSKLLTLAHPIAHLPTPLMDVELEAIAKLQAIFQNWAAPQKQMPKGTLITATSPLAQITPIPLTAISLPVISELPPPITSSLPLTTQHPYH